MEVQKVEQELFIIGGYNTVAVDPIVSDRYYIDKFNDLHFVQGGFSVDKDKKFFDLFKERYDLMILML